MLQNSYLTDYFFIDGQTWKDCQVSFNSKHPKMTSTSNSAGIGGVFQIEKTEVVVSDEEITCRISANPPSSLKKAIWSVYKAYVNKDIVKFSETSPEVFHELKHEITELKLFDISNLKEISFSDFPKKSLKQISFMHKQICKKIYAEALKHKVFKLNPQTGSLAYLSCVSVELKVVNLLSTFFDSYLKDKDYPRALRILEKISFTQVGAESTLKFLEKFFNESTPQSMGECLDRLNKVISGHKPTKLSWQQFVKNNREKFEKQVLQILSYTEGTEIKETLIKEFSINEKDIVKLAEPTERMKKLRMKATLDILKMTIEEKQYDLARMYLNLENFDENTKQKYAKIISELESLSQQSTPKDVEKKLSSNIKVKPVAIKTYSIEVPTTPAPISPPLRVFSRPISSFKSVAPVKPEPALTKNQSSNYSQTTTFDWQPSIPRKAAVTVSSDQQNLYSILIEKDLNALEQNFATNPDFDKLRAIYQMIADNFGVDNEDLKVQNWLQKVKILQGKFEEMGVQINLDY